MAAGCHVTFAWITSGYVDYTVEQEGFAMLTAEILDRKKKRQLAARVEQGLRGTCADETAFLNMLGNVCDKLTRLTMSSWLARWVLQFLQPYILLELRYTL